MMASAQAGAGEELDAHILQHWLHVQYLVSKNFASTTKQVLSNGLWSQNEVLMCVKLIYFVCPWRLVVCLARNVDWHPSNS